MHEIINPVKQVRAVARAEPTSSYRGIIIICKEIFKGININKIANGTLGVPYP